MILLVLHHRIRLSLLDREEEAMGGHAIRVVHPTFLANLLADLVPMEMEEVAAMVALAVTLATETTKDVTCITMDRIRDNLLPEALVILEAETEVEDLTNATNPARGVAVVADAA